MRLYDDPYSGVAPEGPEGIFTEAQITDLVARLAEIDRSAQPAAS